jgi:xylulokinase
MPGGPLVAGVDSSTQATKVVIVDADSGEIVSRGHAPHTVQGTGGARESDPREWWSALQAALHEALSATGRANTVGAISIAGQQHGLVVLDSHGSPLRDAILWNDTRSAVDAERLISELGAPTWADLTGLRPVASFTVCKWAWVRRVEPQVAAQARAIRLPHDYLTERLTGRGTTDRGDVSGTGWWSPATGTYLERILALPEVDLAAEFLPAIVAPTEPAGTATDAAADALGLRPGTIVGPGTGDNMAAALGLGLRAGQAAMSLGTSGTIFAVSETPAADPSGIVAGFADASGRFLPLAATLNCTQAVDRIAAWLGLERDDVAPAGSVVVLPHLDGERTPNLPMASGTITGLRHTTTPQQILMAAYEGALASLLVAFDAIGDAVGGLDPALPLMLVGGGARGRTWRSVVRRLTGRPVIVPEAGELVAVGAAVQAAAILRGEDPATVADRWDSARGELLKPLPVDHERLDLIRAALDAAVGGGSTSHRP